MSPMRVIDDVDAKILTTLQENARISNAEIARRLEMAPSAIFERIRKLEERGVIKGYTARINPRVLGLGMLAYVFVRTEDGMGGCDIAKRLAEIPDVLEVHVIAGEDCYLVKVRAEDTDALFRLLQEQFKGIASLQSTKTTIVLNTVKESTRLRISIPAGGKDQDEAHDQPAVSHA